MIHTYRNVLIKNQYKRMIIRELSQLRIVISLWVSIYNYIQCMINIVALIYYSSPLIIIPIRLYLEMKINVLICVNLKLIRIRDVIFIN